MRLSRKNLGSSNGSHVTGALSQPEDLDPILKVFSYVEWTSLLIVFAILGGVVVWSIVGVLPVKASGRGVIVKTRPIVDVVSVQGGLVISVPVRSGDHISTGQIIARVAQPETSEKLKIAQIELELTKRDREQALHVIDKNVGLRSDLAKLRKANAEREISDLQAQAELAKKQVLLGKQLLESGLITHQQDYANQQAVTAINQEIANRRALIRQDESDAFAIETAPKQTAAEWDARLRRAEMDVETLQKQLTLIENVVAPFPGVVLELKADAGALVNSRAPIAAIEPDITTVDVTACVPSATAKTVRTAMDAEVLAADVDPRERRLLRGKVSYVADYPATPSALITTFGNEEIVKALTAAGPVNEVKIELLPDRRSKHWLAWLLARPKMVHISSGTLCDVKIITKRQRPIVLLFPYAGQK
ncbi:MAG TPA: NHLP bacteriocin system secretion protein [Bryobacteraceae bacterium]|nr:NHLP bacteriocin system secretion protein [Bryobacteraceae bacterium]